MQRESSRKTTVVIIFLVGGIACAGLGCARKSDAEEFKLQQPAMSLSSHRCGINSLYLCARLTGGFQGKLGELYELAGNLDSRGVRASDLVAWGKKIGLSIEGVSIDLGSLMRWEGSAVLHVNGSHYIAWLGVQGDRLVIFDGNIGLYSCTTEWFRRTYDWQGVALLVGRNEASMSESHTRVLWQGVAIFGVAAATVAVVAWSLARQRGFRGQGRDQGDAFTSQNDKDECRAFCVKVPACNSVG